MLVDVGAAGTLRGPCGGPAALVQPTPRGSFEELAGRGVTSRDVRDVARCSVGRPRPRRQPPQAAPTRTRPARHAPTMAPNTSRSVRLTPQLLSRPRRGQVTDGRATLACRRAVVKGVTGGRPNTGSASDRPGAGGSAGPMTKTGDSGAVRHPDRPRDGDGAGPFGSRRRRSERQGRGAPDRAARERALRRTGRRRLGPLTRRAVLQLQRSSGIRATGKVGHLTRCELGRLGKPLLGQRALSRGRVGWDVSVLEFRLRRFGLAGRRVDGRFDAATARALRRYQRSRGSPRTGSPAPGRSARSRAGRSR